MKIFDVISESLAFTRAGMELSHVRFESVVSGQSYGTIRETGLGELLKNET